MPVVDVEERAEPLRRARLLQRLDAALRDLHDLSGAEVADVLVAEVRERARLERRREAALLAPDHDGRAAPAVARGVEDVVRRQQQDRDRALDDLLHVADALDDRVLRVDERGDDLRLHDLAGLQRGEVRRVALDEALHERVGVRDEADRDDRVAPEVREKDVRLVVGVADDADAGVGLHRVVAREVVAEARAERRVGDVVDRAVEDAARPERHAAAVRAEVRVVVRAVEDVRRAVFAGDRSEESAHVLAPSVGRW